MAAGFKIAEPLEYHRSFLKENCRPDGRELSEFRTTTLNIGSISTADGSALVKVGNTTVMCGIKVELTNPLVEAPGKGFIGFVRVHQENRRRPASQFIADVIESSEVIQTEDLCIERGKLCWVLYCDMMCVDYDGNVLDACIIALLAALKNTKLPEVTINKDTGAPEVNLEKRKGLNIRKHPVGASFCVFDDSILIVDPTAEEEGLSTSHLTVVTDEKARLCVVHKPGGTPLSAEKLQECIGRATARQREIQKLVDKVIHSVKTAQ
ncbi:hypothetical protein KUCAC02_003311 [Chaenocephalus aceratus]|uniref:Uncharacterized protein n=1 Tax=Chaenocephalus aceratus TaxID=36190 RepID=A0ACB9WLY3_CHAAC|nr:hypothetical protein KUCAC02_003311 [Chaenocephalus aceratus]